MKYRKKPIVIDAVQWEGCPDDDGRGGCLGIPRIDDLRITHTITEHGISTLEGFMRIHPGDYIITGIKGEVYPCRNDVFEASYEPFNNPRYSGETL